MLSTGANEGPFTLVPVEGGPRATLAKGHIIGRQQARPGLLLPEVPLSLDLPRCPPVTSCLSSPFNSILISKIQLLATVLAILQFSAVATSLGTIVKIRIPPWPGHQDWPGHRPLLAPHILTCRRLAAVVISQVLFEFSLRVTVCTVTQILVHHVSRSS